MLLAVTAARPAAAQQSDLRWSVTETMVLEWHGETDGFDPSPLSAHDRDNYVAIKNRANLGLHRGPLDVTLRFDQSSFFDTCSSMPTDASEMTAADLQGCRSPRPGILEDDYRLERASASLRLGRHRLWFGDFPLQLGRGIALSLRKVSEFGIDDALRGARIQLRLHDDVRLEVFGGQVNMSNLDEVTDTHIDETRDRLAGGRIDGRILDFLNVGAHAMVLIPLAADGVTSQDSQGGAWTLVAGGTAEMPRLWDVMSLYIEANGLARTMEGRGEQQEGFALYSAVDLDLGRLTLLGELKWYEDFLVMGTATDGLGTARPLAQAPTIEREDQFIRSPTDMLGGRLRADLRLSRSALVYLNGVYVNGRGSNEIDAFHGYGGLELRLLGGRINGNVSAGYRREIGRSETSDRPDWGELDHDILHVEGSLTVGLVGRHSLHLGFEHETWNKPGVTQDDRYNRGTWSVGYDYGSMLALSFAYEYDTQFGSNPYQLPAEGGYWLVENGVRQHFAFGEVRYTPLRWLDLRLRGGAQRGGLKCMSGVCRVFPNFTGARLETVLRF